MSRPRPITRGAPRPSNTVVLLREAYLVLNDLVVVRLTELGHDAIRPSHGAVFQYLDETGTTVSALAARAQMTKQAMAELVLHLERHGYVERVPDPDDRRAKLVRPTATGRRVVAIAQELVPEVEGFIDTVLGPERASDLRRDLRILHEATVGRPVH
jgi:DNA-binding MarR family transcriptional regulator